MLIDSEPLIEMIEAVESIRERDVPYILATTLNNLAFDAKDEAEKRLKEDLNIHKKALTRAFRVNKAAKRSLEARLFIDDWKWQSKVLKHHFYGGDRVRKGLEKALVYMGLLEKGEILTPSPNVKVSRGAYGRIMSQLKVHYKSGYDGNETERSRKRNKGRVKERYFIITSFANSHLSPGIYARMPGVNYPIAILRIATKPTYRKRFDLKKIIIDVYDKRANKHLGEAIDRVLTLNAQRGWR